MSFCGVAGCSSSTRKCWRSKLARLDENEDDTIDPRRIILADGSIFDQKSLRFHCMPRLPKLTDNPTPEQRKEYRRILSLRKQWIHALQRTDKLSDDVRVCSLHFAPSAYDPLATLKAGVQSFLDVPTKKLLLPDSFPTENLVNQKSVRLETARSKRMAKKDIRQVVNDLLNECAAQEGLPQVISSQDESLLTTDDSLNNSTSNENANDPGNFEEMSDDLVMNISDQGGQTSDSLEAQIRALWDENKKYVGVASIPLSQENDGVAETCSKTLNDYVLASTKALFDKLKEEKIKSKENQLKFACVNRKLKTIQVEKRKLEAEKKKVEKKSERQEKELEEMKIEKIKLREAIESAGGAISLKAKDEIIRNALKNVFSPTQLDRLLMKKNTRWTQADYNLAISFLCHTSRGYRFARNVLKIPLPAASTVRKQMARFPLEEGLANFALDIMKSKGRCMTPLDRVTALTFDEVHISSNMVYDPVKERVLGPFSKTQVIMAQGIFGEWKNVVYFQHNEDVTPEILNSVITALHDSGFPVASVTCDMGCENRKLYSSLGVDEQKPFFEHPVTKTKIACFHDSPHLIKLARNHLIDHGMTLNPMEPIKKQQHATGDPLIELISKSHLVELQGHNVTWKHLEARQCDRQNVKLAAQVLSNKTATCLSRAANEGHLKSKDSQATAEYCHVFNTFFDIFNIKEQKQSNCDAVPPEKQPFGSCLEEQMMLLEEIFDFVKQMRRKGSRKGSKMIFFQKGVLLNCRALPLLHEELSNMFVAQNVTIKTWYLNQDVLESLFSVLRAMGGNTRPNALEVKYRIRRYMVQRDPDFLLNAKTTNVAPSGSSNLTAKELQNLDIFEDMADDEPDMEMDENEEMELENEESDDEVSSDESEDEGDTSEEDGEEEQSGEKDEEPSSKRLKLHVPPPEDFQNHAFYEQGLDALSAIIAYRIKSKLPHFVCGEGQLPKSYPNWIEHFSESGMAPPTEELVTYVKIMDKKFHNIHGDSVLKEEQLVTKFVTHLQLFAPEIPQKIVATYAKLRILIRVRALNKRNKNQKKEAHNKNKVDKNSRQAEVNKVWRASKV